MNKIKLEVSRTERILIVAALKVYNTWGEILAQRIGTATPYDPADDGPEVAILSVEKTHV